MADLYGSQRALQEDLRAVLQLLRKGDGTGASPAFGRPGDAIVLIQPVRLTAANTVRELEESVWAEIATGQVVARARTSAHESARTVDELLQRVREKNFISGERPISSGGVAAGLALACAVGGHGFDVELTENDGDNPLHALFGERDGRALLACRASAHLALTNFVDRSAHFTAETIGRITDFDVHVRWMGVTVLRGTAQSLAESITG